MHLSSSAAAWCSSCEVREVQGDRVVQDEGSEAVDLLGSGRGHEDALTGAGHEGRDGMDVCLVPVSQQQVCLV